jgi:hypothetical protein
LGEFKGRSALIDPNSFARLVPLKEADALQVVGTVGSRPERSVLVVIVKGRRPQPLNSESKTRLIPAIFKKSSDLEEARVALINRLRYGIFDYGCWQTCTAASQELLDSGHPRKAIVWRVAYDNHAPNLFCGGGKFAQKPALT